MAELTIKVKITPQVLNFIKKHAVFSQKLSPLAESYWKPKGIILKDFPPAKKVIRLRVFLDGLAVVDELNTFLKDGSYTHDKKTLFKGSQPESEAFLQKKNYKKWADFQLSSIEHKIKLPIGKTIKALEEEINGRKTLVKFEAEGEEKIKEVMKLLNLSKKDLILKNRAEIQAEKMGPI